MGLESVMIPFLVFILILKVDYVIPTEPEIIHDVPNPPSSNHQSSTSMHTIRQPSNVPVNQLGNINGGSAKINVQRNEIGINNQSDFMNDDSMDVKDDEVLIQSNWDQNYINETLQINNVTSEMIEIEPYWVPENDRNGNNEKKIISNLINLNQSRQSDQSSVSQYKMVKEDDMSENGESHRYLQEVLPTENYANQQKLTDANTNDIESIQADSVTEDLLQIGENIEIQANTAQSFEDSAESSVIDLPLKIETTVSSSIETTHSNLSSRKIGGNSIEKTSPTAIAEVIAITQGVEMTFSGNETIKAAINSATEEVIKSATVDDCHKIEQNKHGIENVNLNEKLFRLNHRKRADLAFTRRPLANSIKNLTIVSDANEKMAKKTMEVRATEDKEKSPTPPSVDITTIKHLNSDNDEYSYQNRSAMRDPSSTPHVATEYFTIESNDSIIMLDYDDELSPLLIDDSNKLDDDDNISMSLNTSSLNLTTINGVDAFNFNSVSGVSATSGLLPSLLSTAAPKSNVSGTAWPVKHAAVVEGDVVLGGLMMVHSREDSVTCGPIMPQGGIQALEAMLYTLDRINGHKLLPNISLGAHILDDCDKDTYGLEMAVDFIKDGNDGGQLHGKRHRHNHQYFHRQLHSGGSKVFRSVSDMWEEEDNEAPFAYKQWPVKHEAIVEGDVILGGLMMVHSREDLWTCGPIMPQGGIQALEAMLYTLDRVNEIKLLPNITLGAHILDDCDKDTYGLEMAVDFIKGSISNIDGAEYHCNKTQVRKVISGVVGAASSVTSIQVANLLRLFRIPQVSFFSTSPELSNKQRFEYFSRTIPSDHYQVKAMVDIVNRMGWSYVSIIYEESNYGLKAFEELEDLLAKNSICIAVKEKLSKDSGVAAETTYDMIVQKLSTKPRARGAIIFGSDQEVAGVMRAVRRNNATGSFSWIGSDGWSARNLVSDGNEREVEGTLSVQPQANPVKGFEEYFLGLTVENNQRNPWFVEFWEDHFHCRYPNSSRTPYNKHYKKMCTTKEKLTKNNTDFEDQLQFVSDAVMAFAYALRDMHKDLCKGRPGLCDAMRPTKGAELLKYLRNVDFEGLSGDRFRFNENGDGPARYNIIHFKQVTLGKYRWVKVGEYYEGELRLNMSEVQFTFHQPKPPESVCSLPCERGQAKKYVEGESCCWHCFNCTQYQIRHPIDETQCLMCPKGTVPDAQKEFCQDIPEVFLRPESGWAIGAMAFSSTGMLITLFVVGVFLRHNDTPVVRASGRELSYVLLAGILMCYCVTFALVLRPTDIVCGLQRFGAGFCFTVVYAALLTKTNRIARIFKAGKQSAKRPSLISPRSQLIICIGLTSIQVLINGVWMVIAPAHAIHHYPTREDNLLVCDSYIDASYMIAFFYPIVLIVICTVYAILTRKIPEAFNESKHIGFTMYTTCVIWLAFVPLYFGTANHVPLRITSMSVTISLSASVTVACLFSPKLYIILIRPERNVRQSMMPVRYSAINKTSNSGQSMMAAVMVTAATCNQKEKIQKHVPTPATISHDESTQLAEENGRGVKFVEIATQTVTLTNILSSIDSNLSNCHMPYVDQTLPNNKLTNSVVNNNIIQTSPTTNGPPISGQPPSVTANTPAVDIRL